MKNISISNVIILKLLSTVIKKKNANIKSQLMNLLFLHWYEFAVVRVDDGTSLQILVRVDIVRVN
jgi:hypothetical protein